MGGRLEEVGILGSTVVRVEEGVGMDFWLDTQNEVVFSLAFGARMG